MQHGDVLTLNTFSSLGHFGVHTRNPVLGDWQHCTAPVQAVPSAAAARGGTGWPVGGSTAVRPSLRWHGGGTAGLRGLQLSCSSIGNTEAPSSLPGQNCSSEMFWLNLNQESLFIQCFVPWGFELGACKYEDLPLQEARGVGSLPPSLCRQWGGGSPPLGMLEYFRLPLAFLPWLWRRFGSPARQFSQLNQISKNGWKYVEKWLLCDRRLKDDLVYRRGKKKSYTTDGFKMRNDTDTVNLAFHVSVNGKQMIGKDNTFKSFKMNICFCGANKHVTSSVIR